MGPRLRVEKSRNRRDEVIPWLRRWRFDGRDEHLRPSPPPPEPGDFAIAVCIWTMAVWVWIRALVRAFRGGRFV